MCLQVALNDSVHGALRPRLVDERWEMTPKLEVKCFQLRHRVLPQAPRTEAEAHAELADPGARVLG